MRGPKRFIMLKTRIDGKSTNNNSLSIVDEQGEVVAQITVENNVGVTLNINTRPDLHICKPNGWTSNKG